MDRHTASLTAASPREPLGALGERLAAAHLTADDGLEVVQRNWTRRSGEVRGELDLVALDHGARTVVVAEVKTRRSRRHGGPLLAVTHRKQAKVRSLTAGLLRELSLPYRRVRFDVVGLLLPTHGDGRLEHVLGAF